MKRIIILILILNLHSSHASWLNLASAINHIVDYKKTYLTIGLVTNAITILNLYYQTKKHKREMEKKIAMEIYTTIRRGNLVQFKKSLAQCPKDQVLAVISHKISAPYVTWETVLHCAVRNGSIENITELLTNCPLCKRFEYISTKHGDGKTPLHLATEWGNPARTKILLEVCPKDKLFEYISMKDKNGKTALHKAVRKQTSETTKALLKACPQDKLFEYISMKDKNGTTALHRAALYGNLETVKALLKACPQDKLFEYISMKDKNDKTALHWGAKGLFGNSKNNVATLLSKCPKSKLFEYMLMKNKDTKTALCLANNQVYNEKTIKILLTSYESCINIIKTKHKLTSRDIDDKWKIKPDVPEFDIKTTIQLDTAQNGLIDLVKTYKEKENPEILQSICKIIKHCINNRIVSKHKDNLDNHITALLNNNTNANIPKSVKKYYRVLIDDISSNKETEQFKREIQWARKDRKIFGDKAISKDEKYMKNNLYNSFKDNRFSDIELILQ